MIHSSELKSPRNGRSKTSKEVQKTKTKNRENIDPTVKGQNEDSGSEAEFFSQE